MRYILIFVGAAVVAYFLAIGIRAFISQRNAGRQPKNDSNEDSLCGQAPSEEERRRKHTKYRIK